MATSTYSISESARITGKTRDTIRSHIKKSKLSFELDINGNKRIERSELMRVYGNDLDFSLANGKKRTKTSATFNTDNAGNIKMLEEQLKNERSERDRERRQYENQIESLTDALQRSQEGQNRTTLLLENHSKREGDWEASFNALRNAQEQSRHEILELKNLAKRREEKLKRALEAERTKPFWRKILE